MDLKQVFQAEPLSVERVLIEPGRGFYIPAYQRPYAWDRENVAALITSICEGIATLREMDDAITFIGTLIFIHDTQYTTVEPQVRQELPQGVFLVIDGQQRLSTLCLLAVCLHDMIALTADKVKAQDEIDVWINENKLELLNRLENMFSLDKLSGDGHLRWYPRIIRAHADSWGRTSVYAKYHSPISMMIAEYNQRIRSPEPRSDRFDWQSNASESHAMLARNFRYASSALKNLMEAKHSEEEPLPNLFQLAKDSTDLHGRYFWNEVPSAVRKEWEQVEEPRLQTRRIQQLSRLFLFTRYLLDRVAVTLVLAKKEEYAFDLFEALNTTGEPLTAYETFKPTVIKQEGLDKYYASPSAEALSFVEKFMDMHAEKRQVASDRLLIPFALFERGSKLGKHLRAQRNWLRYAYDQAGENIETRRDFLRGMSLVAEFLTHCWPEKVKFSPMTTVGRLNLGSQANEALLCLQVLRDAKHDITVSLLARFYAEAVVAPEAQQKNAVKEFVDALKAVTAFFALWRGSRVGTENIDAVYRSLMSRSENDVGPFRRNGGVVPRADDLRRALRGKLKEKNIDSCASWLDRAVPLSVYTQSKELAKLLLLAAQHDAVPDPTSAGLTTDGKTGSCEVLRLQQWNAGFEVEHIAPRDPKDKGADWDDDIYRLEQVDTLGNLTLLPRSENASAGNKSWSLKRLYFRILGSDEDVAQQLIEEATQKGIQLPESTTELLKAARYLPHIRALAKTPEDFEWSPLFIQIRSKHLAERAWAKLAPWLGL